MPLHYAPPTALQYFSTLVHSDEAFPLLEAAASLGQLLDPALDVQQVLGDLDQLQARLQRRLAADAPALHRLRMLNQFFFTELGFGCNVNDYYNPDNSYLHVLLRTRRGIPVSLAVLWLELAQGLRLDAHGIGFPGHFLLRVQLPQGQVVIDPCSGQSLSQAQLLERLQPYYPLGAQEQKLEQLWSLYMQNATPRAILVRMLGNLQDIHHAQRDWPALMAVLERLIVLQPEHWAAYRDRGLAYAALGRLNLAAEDLKLYLQHAQAESDYAAITALLADLQRPGH